MDIKVKLDETPPREAPTSGELPPTRRREYLGGDSVSNGYRRPHRDWKPPDRRGYPGERPPDRGGYPDRGGRPPDRGGYPGGGYPDRGGGPPGGDILMEVEDPQWRTP